MATIGANALTYADWAKRVDDDGKMSVIIELLSQTNEVLDDMLVIEGNLPTGHKTTIRTGLPESTWRLLNYGVRLSKSTTAQIVDGCGNLETEGQVDVDVADLNGNTAEFRLSESKAFLQSMSQTMAQTVFYGNTSAHPERFMGLAPRYNTLDPRVAETAHNVIDASEGLTTPPDPAAPNFTSVWIVTWGADTIHGIFPKGKVTGLRHEDKGKWRVHDIDGNPYWAYVDHYKWETGLTVRDWRFAVRVANIDVTQLGKPQLIDTDGGPVPGTGAPNLINAIIRGMYRIPVMPRSATPVQTTDTPAVMESMGTTAIYCNRTIRTYLDLQALDKANVLLRLEEFHGRPVTTFRGIPVRTVDAIVNNEAYIAPPAP